ncbi:MAG: restriction endonuclease subunit S [Gammaproteobacteria bacterium]|nr:restriction endonuclease subunit S [Gammaproteobacteria bacterium]
MNWQRKTLEEIAEFTLGKMLDEKKNKGELLPYLANVNVRWGSFELDELREMKFEGHEKERFGLKYGDIVMCEGGEPGRCAIWKDQKPNMMIQKALHRIRPYTDVDGGFLFYSFLHKGKAGGFAPLFTGSTIKHLPKEKLAKVEVDVPPLQTQQRIASILSAYDDLIEINRRRIQLLEQSARLLYKEWFVHLRFPCNEHVKIKDGLPEGWEKTTVGHVSSFVSRGITPKYDDEANGTVINQKCIRDGRVTMDLARRQSKEVPPNKLVNYGDVLVNSTGQGTLGRVAQFLDTVENCTIDSHITIARPDEDVPVFLYGQHISSMEDYLASMGRGATNQTELSKDVVAELSFLRPPHLLADQFESFAKDTADQARNLTQQNTKLTKARDLLLPRLMNGEVVV